MRSKLWYSTQMSPLYTYSVLPRFRVQLLMVTYDKNKHYRCVHISCKSTRSHNDKVTCSTCRQHAISDIRHSLCTNTWTTPWSDASLLLQIWSDITYSYITFVSHLGQAQALDTVNSKKMLQNQRVQQQWIEAIGVIYHFIPFRSITTSTASATTSQHHQRTAPPPL